LIQFGNTTLKAIFTPGHSPASLSFYCEKDRFLIAGDVLFKNSIGRYDLPGGNLNTLMKSIKEKLMILPDDVKVHSGHGPSTTIGEERRNNPYLVD
jgi:glyoxylase-like metal-dependent hydrolase (beta-lactamase superfamily II)